MNFVEWQESFWYANAQAVVVIAASAVMFALVLAVLMPLLSAVLRRWPRS